MAWVSNPGHKTAGDAHHFIFFHVSPTNHQPTIRGVDLCHKNVQHPWFTETRVIRYQPFVSAHNARFHSECNTNDKGSNQTCQNNITLPTNIQYLKIHIRNWIRSQTSQWDTNRIKWTWGDKLHPTAVRTVQHHFTSRLTQLWLALLLKYGTKMQTQHTCGAAVAVCTSVFHFFTHSATRILPILHFRFNLPTTLPPVHHAFYPYCTSSLPPYLTRY